MYICGLCGNKKYFIEINCTETEVTLDERAGEITGSHDTFVTCERVTCGVCGASSEDGNILSRATAEPIHGGQA